MGSVGQVWLFVAFLMAFGNVAWGEDALKRYARAELHMGVEFEVVVYAADAMGADAAIGKAFARVAELDKALSDYDPESELSKLSETSVVVGEGKNGPFPVVAVGDDLWTVLNESQVISQASAGAFDVTIGPLTKLWRRARRWKELPAAETLAAARTGVGFRFLQLNLERHTAQLLRPNMRLDLGGIAKGYAADEAVKAASRAGVSRVLVRASGDIAVGEPPPGERGWRVGIAPLNADEPPSQFVEIANCGISTAAAFGRQRSPLFAHHRSTHRRMRFWAEQRDGYRAARDLGRWVGYGGVGAWAGGCAGVVWKVCGGRNADGL